LIGDVIIDKQGNWRVHEGLFLFPVNPDKKSDGNPPQGVCNNGKQLNAIKDRSCHGGIIAKRCHESNKKNDNPYPNEHRNCQ
jgi:hypothetical protein